MIAQCFESFVSKSTSIRPEHSSNVENSFVSNVKFADYSFTLRDTMFSAVWWRWDRLKAQHIVFCLKWNEQWCQYSCASAYWNKNQWTTKPNWFRWAFFTNVRGWSLFTSGPSPTGGQLFPAPLFEICDPPFNVWPLVAPYIQYRILKMWAPLCFLAPPSCFWPTLLLNPGDGPGHMLVITIVERW